MFSIIHKLDNPFILTEAVEMKGLEFIKHLGGSTGADLYKDQSNKLWVLKTGNHVDHMYNEYVANRLYHKLGEKAGIHVPKGFIGIYNNQKYFVMEYIEDGIPLAHVNSNIKQELLKGFILDVLLANWDVVGTNWDMDNVRYSPSKHKFYRIDVGGSLLYRAQGAPKGERFSSVPNERHTLPENIHLFDDISDRDILHQIKKELYKMPVNMFSIRPILLKIKQVLKDEDVELSKDQKQEIYQKLFKRCINLAKMIGIGE